MASNQSILKRSIPLLLALVVLMSCLPMIPVAADEIYSLDGSWQFTDDFRGLVSDFYFDYSFYCEGTLFYGFVFYVRADELWFFTSETDKVCVYDFRDGGWISSLGCPVISFAAPVQVTYGEHMFFERSLMQIEDEPVLTYSTKVYIGSNSYIFTSTNGTPEVHLVVNETGAVMSSDGTVYTYTYSGDGIFQGLSRVSDGSSITYPIGSSDYIHGTNTLYPIAGDVYTSTITIDGESFIFSSLTEQPAVTLKVTDTRVTLSFNGESRIYVYSGEGSFQGLSYSATGAASLVPGGSYALAAGDHTLYAIASTSSDEPVLTYSTKVYIGSNSYIFTSTNGTPEVHFVVNETGAVMSSDGTVYTYTYSGDGIFQGLSRVSDGSSITYPIGSSDYIHGTNTLYPIAGDVYTSTITIDDESFIFSSLTEQPAVTLKVTDTRVTLSFNGESRIYVYSGEGSFQGLSYSATGAASLVPGGSYALAAGDHTLYAIASTSSDEVAFSSKITIGGQTYTFSGDNAKPKVLLSVNATGAVLSAGSTTYTYTYSVEGSFQGLSFSPTGSALFVPGQSYELVAGDHTLYPISSASDVINTGLWRVKLDSAGSSVALSAWPSSLSSVNFDFRSDTNDWTGFSYADGTLNYLVGSAVVDAYVYSSSAWTLEEFKTVYLASDQLVDAAFAAWFTTNFERIGDDPDEPVYTTTINVYNNDGSQLLGSFSAEGLSESPNLLLTVRPDGLKVDGPDGLTWSWDASGLRLAGFSYSSSSSAADLSVYFSTAVGKKSANVVRDLYVVEGDIGTEQAQGVLSGFISFLITPLQAFFAIEFIPGLSFGKIAMFAFLLGLVFWFFKASK